MIGVRVEERGFASAEGSLEEASKLLLEASEHKFEEGYAADEAAIRAFHDTGLDGGHRLYLATDGTERLVGAAEVRHDAEDANVTVLNMAVEESERHHGIGSLLIKQIAVHAAMREEEKIYIVSLEDAFFQQLGFVAANEHIMVASPLDVIRS